MFLVDSFKRKVNFGSVQVKIKLSLQTKLKAGQLSNAKPDLPNSGDKVYTARK